MELKIKIDNIDHESIIKIILPVITSNADAIQDKTLRNIANMAGAMNISGDSLAKMLAFVPQDVKDNIIVYFVQNHKDIVLDFAKNMMLKNGVNVDIEDIDISKD